MATTGGTGLLERAYERQGTAYPRRAIGVVAQLALAFVAMSIAALALFVDMSLSDFVRLSLVGLVGLVVRGRHLHAKGPTRPGPGRRVDRGAPG